MTKYLLDDRERNCYDDSDFYAIFWDTDTNTVRSEFYGSTRYYSPRVAPSEYIRPVPDDIMIQAQEFLYARAYEQIKAQDERLVNEPDDVRNGELLETLKAGTFKNKRTSSTVEYQAGELGRVIWIGAFGTFYRNGYNHRGRHNLRVGLKFDDGRVIFIGLKDCKLARPLLTDDEISKYARATAEEKRFISIF